MATQEQAFKIRWGKLSLALVGVLALLAVPVTFVVACLTSLSFLVPSVCAVLVVASFVGLRTSAIRERRRKAWARAEFAVPEGQVEEKSRQDSDEEAGRTSTAEAESAEAEKDDSKESASGSDEKSVEAAETESTQATHEQAEEAFDFEAASETDRDETKADAADAQVSPAADAETDVEHKKDAEQGGTADAESAEAATTASAESTWSPRSVPAPTYTTAEPVERALPAAEPAAEEKKATTVTSIRKAERDRADLERTGTESHAVELRNGNVEDEITHPESAKRLDLDAVLQRRRA